MSDQLRDVLERMSEEAPVPDEIPPLLGPRVRRRRVLNIGAALTVLAVAAYGSAITIRAFAERTPIVPGTSPRCEWTRRESPSLDPSQQANRFLAAAAPLGSSFVVGVGDVLERRGAGESHSMFSLAVTSEIHLRDAGEGADKFTGVAATSASDVWMVGFAGTEGVAFHWDGSRLEGQSLAQPIGRYWHLADVVAFAENDVWAVGGQAHAGTGNPPFPLVQRWNGSTWRAIAFLGASGPEGNVRGTLGTLEGISGTGPQDVWAVGGTTRFYELGRSTPLVAHWNGERWALEPVVVDARLSRFMAVEAVASDDVWAVGVSGNTREGYGGEQDTALVAHRDAAGWAVSELPPLPRGSRLFGITAVSSDEVYAVGSSGVAGSYSPLILRWDGSEWTREFPAESRGWLFDVVASHDGVVTAVGTSGGDRTLVMRCEPPNG